ncbi:hypothetical protein [Alloactinosynnema sp. L-07]|nr:hypothetical protein [Alloactinosynnema sp. L-07]
MAVEVSDVERTKAAWMATTGIATTCFRLRWTSLTRWRSRWAFAAGRTWEETLDYAAVQAAHRLTRLWGRVSVGRRSAAVRCQRLSSAMRVIGAGGPKSTG